jgi:hypothetical protein
MLATYYFLLLCQYIAAMIEIEDKLISLDIFEKKFVCDLNACKGACCVEGDAGAPLNMDEIDIIEESLEAIKPYMRQEGIDAIEKSGVFYMDEDNEPVTTLVNGSECAFVYFDENNITKCSIEKAHKEGKLDFKKPISCHLYPIRVAKYRKFQALNYNEWHICKPACACGNELNVPVYKFLKEPITRAWGESFFNELELVAKELENQ